MLPEIKISLSARGALFFFLVLMLKRRNLVVVGGTFVLYKIIYEVRVRVIKIIKLVPIYRQIIILILCFYSIFKVSRLISL